ncbi:MAG: 2-C-methyl-D-erythritol 4-phosphate cytidylyltransferase [Alistipes senegalensis]|nr:2-C-methyl-D-erythritol 4-phosphate cytidylyltransferase [Oxalobacter formigenes]MCM1281656.1 2-C-methyl-D-erythritol 4-phosphate cytidylyltransferase [Alistipes senegalensis]
MPENLPSLNLPRYYALVPAAGVGKRMGAALPKQYLSLAGKPVLQHVIEALAASPHIRRVYVVLSPDDAWIDGYMVSGAVRLPEEKVVLLRCGGATRRDSVVQGLKAMAEVLLPTDWVLVHDAARPGLTPELIERLIGEAGNHPVGGLLALPVADTVKRERFSQVETIPREGVWLAQTPQMFRYGLLLEALAKHHEVTDEAGAVEAMGFSPRLVEGHLCNSKITRPADLEVVEMFLAWRTGKKNAGE